MKNSFKAILAALIALTASACTTTCYDPEGIDFRVEISHSQGGYTIYNGPTGEVVEDVEYQDCVDGRLMGLNGNYACMHQLSERWFILEPKPVEGYQTPGKIYFTGDGYAYLYINYETAKVEESLACPQKVDGTCMQQEDGTNCLLKPSLARSVTEANRRLVEDGKPEMRPLSCYRPAEELAKIYKLSK